MTLIGVVFGAAYGLLALHQTYESEARVVVHPITGDNSKPAEPVSDVAMTTERELVGADGVVALVQKRTGWKGTPDEFRGPLQVRLVGGTQTMAISYRAGHPQAAQLGAQAFADGYLAYRSTLAATARDGARQNLEAALKDAADRINKVRASLGGSAVGAQTAADSLLQEAAPFQSELASVNSIDTNAAGSVVQPAPLPSAPAGPGPLAAVGIGALLGLGAGIATAILRGRVDRRLRGHRDLEAQLGAPVLTDIPRTRRDGHDAEALVTMAVPDGPAAEAYRRLRAQLLTMADRSGLKTVMVASPSTENGSTAIAANLAVSIAAAGRRVSLVSADLRTPFLHRYFGLRNDRGLSTVLAGQAAPSDVVYEPPGLQTLQVLPSGPALAEPSDLLGSDPMRVVLAERCEAADFVVVEAPPTLAHSESLTLAPMVDAIVVVADARHATRAELAEVSDQFRLVGGNVVGAVLCNVRP